MLWGWTQTTLICEEIDVDVKCWNRPECASHGCVSPLPAAGCQVPVQSFPHICLILAIDDDRYEDMRLQ